VGEQIVLHPFTRDLEAPRTVGELTAQTVKIGERLLAERSAQAEIAKETTLPEDLLTLLFDNRLAREALVRDPQSTIESADGYEVALHYGGEPVLRPGIGKTVGVSVRAEEAPERLLETPVVLSVPEGWEVEAAAPAGGERRFRLRAHRVAPRNAIIATVGLPGGPREFTFTVLGPDEARGWSAKDNVEYCPLCQGRAGACACRCACEEGEEG
jgi:hypothetical protein